MGGRGERGGVEIRTVNSGLSMEVLEEVTVVVLVFSSSTSSSSVANAVPQSVDE